MSGSRLSKRTLWFGTTESIFRRGKMEARGGIECGDGMPPL